jgi:hypothetical protein
MFRKIGGYLIGAIVLVLVLAYCIHSYTTCTPDPGGKSCTYGQGP